MPGRVTDALRLGSIEFINSLPVDWGLLNGKAGGNVIVTRGTPAELNRRIIDGSLDVSPVSALWYGRHHRELFLLPELLIGSESGVKSVLLFSRVPMKDLAGKKIAFSGKGFTTPALLGIICRLRDGFVPDVVQVPVEDCHRYDAWLVIGDEALIENERQAGSDIRAIDLAEEWERWTSLPVVFAVWAVRKDVCLSDPERIAALAQDLVKSRNAGLEHMPEIIDESCRRTGLARGVIEKYFSHLSYDFNERLKAGLELYFRYALECGLLDELPRLEPIPGQALTT